uniref:Uncharacterized protein n=1 Tax=Arundo donax TaxID=35708 RepID=A0A0A9BY25_ARUDO
MSKKNNKHKYTSA